MADHVCPPWVGYILLSPFRKLGQNPCKMLAPYIEEGMTVMDYGCAMGFFSLGMAEMVGDSGKVICADVQEVMLDKLRKRASKAGLLDRIVLHKCEWDGTGLDGMDSELGFILAYAVMHEITSSRSAWEDLFRLLSSDGRLLLSEPNGYVTRSKFESSLKEAEDVGFHVESRPSIIRSRSALLKK